jgi:hypothetical protein
MRLGHAMFLGSIAALLTLAAPTLARNSNHEQKTSEAPASSSCNAYQQAPDGTWTPLPCHEMGRRPMAQPKSASKSGDEETR